MPNVRNPEFRHELAYPNIKLPDAGFQMLAAYRFWSIIEYWFHYRDVLGEKWEEVLRQSISKIGLAKTLADYSRELMALIARAHATHADLWSSLAARPPVGDCRLPVTVRFIEKQAVITGYSDEEAGKASSLSRGDVIRDLDGVPVAKLVEQWTPTTPPRTNPPVCGTSRVQ